ncbi:MAG TPA: hypothetical protein ENJ99_02100 [Rhizobiales bacterium]|nr:hypothetical protein [Hyphomicrobiales bacterium]
MGNPAGDGAGGGQAPGNGNDLVILPLVDDMGSLDGVPGGLGTGDGVILRTVDGMAGLDGQSELQGQGAGSSVISQLVEWIGGQGTSGWMRQLRDDFGYDAFAGQSREMSIEFNTAADASGSLSINTLVVENAVFIEIEGRGVDSSFLSDLKVLGRDGGPRPGFVVRIDDHSLVVNAPAGSQSVDLKLSHQGAGGSDEFWDIRVDLTSGEITPVEHGGHPRSSGLFNEQLKQLAGGAQLETEKLVNALTG